MRSITAATPVAGVVGAPVRHSLSPLLHNAWLAAGGLDGVYVAFAPPADGFVRFVDGLRGGAVAGLNITLPFKEQALQAADRASPLARAAGAANLLLFHADGTIEARNTDGEGMLGALAAQAPGFSPTAGPVVVLGAGGAARGAVAALAQAGAPEIRVVNRTALRAAVLAGEFDERVGAWELEPALEGAAAVINATSAGLGGGRGLDIPWTTAPPTAVAMDMVYKPLRTAFLQDAAGAGLRTVDGLEMLIRQAIPSFEAFFGAAPPAIDARALLLRALEVGV